MTALLMALAGALDWLLGEPRRWRPLVSFARLAAWLERRYAAPDRMRGALLTAALLLPATALTAELARLPGLWGAGFSLWTLILALGHKRLHDQARLILNGEAASPEITASTCANVLENDGVFATLFWFLVAGAEGAVLFRLTHALAAQWNDERRDRHEFGWAAANLDDMLGIVPARLAALTYAVFGQTRQALTCWREQAPAWGDSNAAPVLAAGAGGLGFRLGDPERELGVDGPPEAADIERALALVRHGVLLWLASIGAGAAVWWGLGHYAPDWNRVLDFFWESFLA